MNKHYNEEASPILPNTHTGFGSAARRPSASAISGDFSVASGGLAVTAAAIGAAVSVSP